MFLCLRFVAFSRRRRQSSRRGNVATLSAIAGDDQSKREQPPTTRLADIEIQSARAAFLEIRLSRRPVARQRPTRQKKMAAVFARFHGHGRCFVVAAAAAVLPRFRRRRRRRSPNRHTQFHAADRHSHARHRRRYAFVTQLGRRARASRMATLFRRDLTTLHRSSSPAAIDWHRLDYINDDDRVNNSNNNNKNNRQRRDFTAPRRRHDLSLALDVTLGPRP